MNWSKVADHLQEAAQKYAEAGDNANARNDRDAKIILTLTGGLCSILACALREGLEDEER